MAIYKCYNLRTLLNNVCNFMIIPHIMRIVIRSHRVMRKNDFLIQYHCLVLVLASFVVFSNCTIPTVTIDLTLVFSKYKSIFSDHATLM